MALAPHRKGFTLVEIAIVFVIIGLIVGGVLAGKELIHAAMIRKQVSQIEEFNVAVTTFMGKYNTLPGDLSPAEADQFGFAERSGAIGHGNRDGTLDPCDVSTAFAIQTSPLGCENLLFWGDLSIAKMITGDFSANSDADVSSADFDETLQFFPTATIERVPIVAANDSSLRNKFILMKYYDSGAASGYGPALNVFDAYNIDTKMDDGLATSGIVLSVYPSGFTRGYLAHAGQIANPFCYSGATGVYSTASPPAMATCMISIQMSGS